MNHLKTFIEKIKERKIDGRWFLGGHHLLLVCIAFLFFNLQRSLTQTLFAFFVGIVTELSLAKIIPKDKGRPFMDRAFSAATESAGIVVLTKSSLWWNHGLLSFLAVSSKYFLRREDGSHIFNPTNFAITVGLILMPTHWFGTWSDEFMISIYPLLQVAVLGAIAVWLAKTYVISLAYIASVIFWIIIFFPLHSLSDVIYALGPELGTTGLIYLLLMITDPKTAPVSYLHQSIYAFMIAFVHLFLRHEQLLYSRYIALFIVTVFIYAYPKRLIPSFLRAETR